MFRSDIKGENSRLEIKNCPQHCQRETGNNKMEEGHLRSL